MVMFGRAVAAFVLMVAAGYLAVVALTPQPSGGDWRPEDMTGASAASRLSQQAEALVSHKAAAALQ